MTVAVLSQANSNPDFCPCETRFADIWAATCEAIVGRDQVAAGHLESLLSIVMDSNFDQNPSPMVTWREMVLDLVTLPLRGSIVSAAVSRAPRQ